MWLDGIFMADTFYAKWTHRYDRDNQTAWDDILQQYDLIETHTRNETSGLHVHGWAEGDAPWADPETGRAPNVWGRAVGWYFMSLVEVLQWFPPSHSGYEKLHGYFTRLARALKAAQDPASGSWWQVMNEPYPGMEGNYVESSASAMFTWGFLKGINLGYLPRDDFLETAKTSYTSLVDNFIYVEKNGTLSFNGTVAECGLSDANVTFEASNTLLRVLCHGMLLMFTWCSTTSASLSTRMIGRAQVLLCLQHMSGRHGRRMNKSMPVSVGPASRVDWLPTLAFWPNTPSVILARDGTW